MSNSPLVSYIRLSPNYSSRTTSNIDRITPHHTAGVVSIETLGSIFAPTSRKASSTYGIGYDGRIGMFVDEKNRPWTSSSSANDNRAITIEVSNSQSGGNWPVSDAAYKSLVNLCVDICQRHGKKKLLFLGDKGTTLAYQPKLDEMVLTMHKWFWATSCPGPYLESRFPQLAAEVTQRLNPKKEEDKEMAEPIYKDVKDVPDYWRASVQKLLDAQLINGGTPADVNPTDVNLTRTEAKLCHLFVTYVDMIADKVKGVL